MVSIRRMPLPLFGLALGCCSPSLATPRAAAAFQLDQHDPALPQLPAAFMAWVVQTRTLNRNDGSAVTISNYGFHYAYDSAARFSCVYGGQDLKNPSQERYRELAWYPLNQTYIWGAGGNCKLLNLTSPLLNWTVPAAWTSKLDFAGTGYVQATQCNHWHATGVDYVGDTSWIPGHPFNSTLKMSIDLWYSIAANAPQLIIRMIPLPNGSRAVITTTSVGYKAHIDGSSSEVCSPPPMCDGKPTPSVYGTYCIAKKDAQQGQLGGAVGYACGELASHGFDCATGIPPGCVDDLHLKANYIFSTYEEKKLGSCDFGGVAMLSDPNGQTPPCVNRNGTW